MKVLRFLSENILFVLTLFLLAFIPLYPKLPLLDIKNTWVYVRAEDFVVVLVFLVWIVLLFRKKIAFKTPLTLPILVFWITGAIATIHGVLLIFPQMANVFPNVAFLSFLRRIEYLSLFFIAYAGMAQKRFFPYIIIVVVATLFLVIGYGFGQKYFGFPAYLTMNEEFAKGTPIRLSALSRVPSTFSGHYDLAAYLVLIIPILVSLGLGIRNWFVRLPIALATFLGTALLFMTVSRVSFFALLVSILIVLFFHRKKRILLSLPIVVAILGFLFLSLTPALIARFGNTVKEIDVLVDANTGQEIGHVKEVPAAYFKDVIIERRVFRKRDDPYIASPRDKEELLLASASAVIPYAALSPQVIIVLAPNTPTGENLPQGTGYINLSLSPVKKRMGEFFYKRSAKDNEPKDLERGFVFSGDFLIKRAAAYDLSFTTRFQGEWPHALEAFRRNILFGSGYSSISLAVDNNYLRILGEVGLLGFLSFFAIFVACGIYIRKVLPYVDSPVVKSFVWGFIAGAVGLFLNAILIDVFEASKIAYLFWLLTGVTVGILHFYQKEYVHIYKELKKIVISRYAIVIYLFVISIFIFLPMVSNYFVGDDFTWLRWAGSCQDGCVFRYFTESDGFFYRPGTKVYFLLMYSLFWLNQTAYHLVSISLHFTVALLLFFLAQKILRNILLSALASFLFLILSGYSEAVFWISSTGYLFNAVFILLSLLFYILWEEQRKTRYYIFSFLSFIFALLFHELGIVAPLFIVLYKFTQEGKSSLKNLFGNLRYVSLLSMIIPYLFMRFLAHSHWLSGDYNYNFVKLPFNTAGNIIGYFMITIFGPMSFSLYETLRNFSKTHVLLTIPVFLCLFGAGIFLYRVFATKIDPDSIGVDKEEKKVILFGSLFFVTALLPFLGLGNITSRYSYLSSVGFVILFAYLIKKLYSYLQSYGRDIAMASVSTVISIFFLLHIIQVQQVHGDWHEAGLKVKRFFTGVDSLYGNNWSKNPMQFYFVDVPIKHGFAWVFPVGLQDALWFPLRNENLTVNIVSSAPEILDTSKESRVKVFKFDKEGHIFEVVRIKGSPPPSEGIIR